MPLRSIVGHRHVVDLLARAVARESLPPSLILSGPEGVGKRRVALALAQALNCTWRVANESGIRSRDSGAAPDPSFDACGKFGPCRRIEKGSFPDVMVVDEDGVHPEVLDVEVKPNSTIIPVEVIREVIKTAREPGRWSARPTAKPWPLSGRRL